MGTAPLSNPLIVISLSFFISHSLLHLFFISHSMTKSMHAGQYALQQCVNAGQYALHPNEHMPSRAHTLFS